MRHALAVLLLALAGLSACAPVPRPFKDDLAKQAVPSVGPRGAAVVVAPPEGGPPGLGGPIADALVERLRAMGVPASGTDALTAGLLLNGRYIGPDAIRWSVLDAQGGERIAFVTAGGAAAVDMAADRVALFLGRDPDAAQARAPAPTRLIFLGMRGAPGRGDAELSQAFRALAEEAGLPLTDTPDDATLALSGEAAMRPLEPGSEELRLDWIVTDRRGREVGRLTQARAVPAGALDGRWGGLAYDAALATVRSLGETLTRLEGQARAQAPDARGG